MTRRTLALGACALALDVRLSAVAETGSGQTLNLVPEAPGRAPNYWCTWALQNYMHGQGSHPVTIAELEGDAGANLARSAMTESNLLGDEGWARTFFPRIRQDLYLLLDDGWEQGGMASFQLDVHKFPSFPGPAAMRLGALNRAIRKQGWRSVAVWCRNPPGADRDRALEAMSQEADVPYWKVDMGDPEFHLTQLARSEAHPLTLEHVHGESPLNGDWRRDGRFGPQPTGSRRQQILANTDVYRTYDVTAMLSLPTTIDRMAEMLQGAQRNPKVTALLNVEDEVYLAAAMGCTMGVMRHPLRDKRSGDDVDLFLNGPRQIKRRMDEVVRALRWQRLAPPFSAGLGTFRSSSERLRDDWHFERGQTWDSAIVGQTTFQSAPAVVARGKTLPSVRAAGEKPFVCASQFPNGAVAIYTGERTHSGRAWTMPPADVHVSVGDAPGPYAIFGAASSITLEFGVPRGKRRRLFAQDLLASEAIDVTHLLADSGRSATLSEADVCRIGLAAATPGDLSAPGMVLAWENA